MEQEEEGMTLIDIIKATKEGYKEFKNKWVLFTVFICITSLSGLLFSFYSKPKYIATSTMMLESSGGGSMSGAFALASQLGIGGGSSPSSMTEDKVTELIKVEAIIKTALLKKVTIDSTTDILANHFIDLFGYKKMWKDDDSLKNFRFKNFDGKITLQENKVLKIFCQQIINQFLITDKSKSGIITVTITTTSEALSKYLNEYLINAVSGFYNKHITEKGEGNLALVQVRVDSIANALKNAESGLAKWKDASNHLVKAQGMIEQIRLERNVELCEALYLEGMKQLEISKYSLLQQAPLLQIIDKPSFPLGKKGKIAPVLATIIGFLSGVLLSVLLLFIIKKHQNLMTKLKSD